MRYVDFSALGERYYDTVLPNGLHLRVVPKADFAKKYAFLALNYGAVDTKFTMDGKPHVTPDGVAHYLEHKMFDMPYGDAMNRFADLGGNPNAFTSYTMTAYYVECTDRLEENLQTLVEFVFTPYFTQKSVDKEQGIIAQEIKMYRDSADSRVYENLFAALYEHHPVRVPIAGTVESIGAITPAVLESCHRAFYTPANAMLCVVGDVQAEEVAAWAEKYTPSVPSCRAVPDYGMPEKDTPHQTHVEEVMEIAMPTFVVGFKDTPPASGEASMKQEFIGDLAADLLLGASAPLYTKLYDQGLVESSFSAGYEGLRGVSMFSAGGDSRDPDAVVDAILKEAERVTREGVDEGLFYRVKKSTMGHKLRDLDGFETTCYRTCAYFFDGAEYFDFSRVMQSVTPEDVQAYISRCLRPEKAAVSVIRPKR